MLDLDFRGGVNGIVGHVVLTEFSLDNGRILLSSECLSSEEIEFWLKRLEVDIADIRKKAELLRIGERRDLYWVSFEYEDGSIGTWADYASSQDEFLKSLNRKYRERGNLTLIEIRCHRRFPDVQTQEAK